MANLNEYLGAIVANLSQARVLADLESAKIAMTYASDDLLRYFSIPRMRIEGVELTVPVAVSEFEANSDHGVRPDNKILAELTYSEILATFNIASLPEGTAEPVRKEILAQVVNLTAKLNRENSELLINDYVASIAGLVDQKIAGAMEAVKKEKDVRQWRDIREVFTRSLTAKLRSAVKPGGDVRSLGTLRVVVESDKLKERDPNTLMTIKMKISEEAMEWERWQDDKGNTVSKLMTA